MYELQKLKLPDPFEDAETRFHKHFPSEGDLANLSNIVYSQSGSASQLAEKENTKDLVEEWIVLGIYSGNKIQKDGYFGAAYFHRKTKHLVICHQGTKLTNTGAIETDWKIFCNVETKQVWSAYLFTRAVIIEFDKFSSSITTTGHSLGGWLSQTTAFFLEYPQFVKEDLSDHPTFLKDCVTLSEFISYKPERIWNSDTTHHIHTVAFDTPGVKDHLEAYMQPEYNRHKEIWKRQLMLDALDISCYLSEPNLINTLGFHIGTIYTIYNCSDSSVPIRSISKSHSKGFLSKLIPSSLSSHSISNFLEFFKSSNINEILTVECWPSGYFERTKPRPHDSDTKKIFCWYSVTKFEKSDMYPISIFNQDEKKFLKNISYINLSRKIDPTIEAWSETIQNKTILNYFESFEICEENRLKIAGSGSLDTFLLKTKWLVNSKEKYQDTVNSVILNHPTVCENIYGAIGRHYLSGLTKFNCSSNSIIAKLDNFLFKNDSQFVLTCSIHKDSASSSAAIVYSSLKYTESTKHFTDARTGLFLDTKSLVSLNSELSLKNDFYFSKNLKLIVVTCETENSETICLLKEIVEKIKIKLLILAPDSTATDQISISVEDLEINYSMLDNAEKKLLSNRHLTFNGNSVFLKDVVEDYDFDSSILWELLKTSDIVIGEHIPNDFGEIYIERHFKQMVLKDKQQPIPNKEIFLIQGATLKNIKNLFHLESTAACQLLSREFVTAQITPSSKALYFLMDKELDVEIVVSKFLNEKFGGHLFRYESDGKARLVYESTFGSSETLSIKLEQDNQPIDFKSTFKISASKILNLSQRVKIIVDEPGMGKSMILKQFAQEYQTQELTNWSFYIDLASWKSKLSNAKPGTSIINDISDYLFEGSQFKNLEINILRNLLELGRVSFFFDSFDEISKELQNVTANLIKGILRSNVKAKIWIACRPHLKEFLESTFETCALAFTLFSQDERMEFLEKLWMNQTNFRNLLLSDEASTSAKLLGKIYATSLLKELNDSLEEKEIDKFIGIPLHLYIIGNLTMGQFLSYYKKKPDENISSECTFGLEFNSIFELYQLFVERKYRIMLEEKIKIPFDSKYQFVLCRDRIAKIHRLIAFSFYFPENTNIFSRRDAKILNDNGSRDELNRVGLLYTENQSYKSVHPTVTEYFVAEFIVSKLAKLEHPTHDSLLIEFLKQNYFNESFDKIRYLMDHFIAYHIDSNKIFKKFLQMDNRKEIFEHLEKESNVTDFLGRTVLHYAMIYEDHWHVGMLWIIIQNQHLIETKDKLGTTFASYIPLSKSFKCFKHRGTPSDMFEDLLKFSPFKDIIFANENNAKLCWMVWFLGYYFKHYAYDSYHARKYDTSIKKDFEDLWINLEYCVHPELILKLGSKFQALIAHSHSISIDLNIFAIRGHDELGYFDYNTFGPYTIQNITGAFETAISIARENQVKFAMQLFSHITFIESLSSREKEEIHSHFIVFISKENYQHYRACLPYISIEFEIFLWKKGNQEKIFEIMLNNNMISWMRAINDRGHDNFVIELLRYAAYTPLKQKMTDCILDNDHYLLTKIFSSRTISELKIIWDLLDTSVQEKILKLYCKESFHSIEDINDAKKFMFYYNSASKHFKESIENDTYEKKYIAYITQLAKTGKGRKDSFRARFSMGLNLVFLWYLITLVMFYTLVIEINE